MADAQLPHDNRAARLQGDAALEQLVSEHHALDEQVRHLSAQSYLTLEQQFTEIALKKRKLALKDRIQALSRQRQAQAADSA
jgi:uncharacterized protein YdcH (DUF465 family)